MPVSVIELWWGSGSSPSRRVMLALGLKGIPYEGHLVSFSNRDLDKPAFLALNPRGQVPTIRHGDFVLYESLAILAWLDHGFPDPPLFGRTAEERGLVWRLCLEEENHFDDVFRHSVRPFAFGQAEQKADAIRAGLPALHEELRLLEQRVASGFLVGDTLSAADLVWFCSVGFVVRAVTRPAAAGWDLGILPLGSHYPGILAWARRIEALPGYDTTIPPHWLEGEHPVPRRLS